MSKHTPGPWKSNVFLVTAVNGREVLHTGLLGRRKSSHPDQSGGDEDVANARLSAAAPELLEACKAVRVELVAMIAGLRESSEHEDHALAVGWQTLVDQIDKAIALAEKEGER